MSSARKRRPIQTMADQMSRNFIQEAEEATQEPKPKKRRVEVPDERWEEHEDGLLVYSYLSPKFKKHKIAAFDFDSTIVSNKSGNRFAQDSSDWQFWDPSVPSRIAIEAKDAEVIICTNQVGITSAKTAADRKWRKSTFQLRMEAVCKELNVPVLVLAATGKNRFRKPCVGMFRFALDKFAVPPDLSDCFYVGDAAGRDKSKGRKKDHSACDYLFALNNDIAFMTPEKYFLASCSPLDTDPTLWSTGNSGFCPKTIPTSPTVPECPLNPGPQEIVLLCGPPASGKSLMCQTWFPTYTRINQDALRTRAKCKTAAKNSLDMGESVVIDSTNRDEEIRKEWVDLAAAKRVQIRCICINMSKPMCFHLNAFRQAVNRETSVAVPPVAIHTFFKHWTPPTTAEGFAEVHNVEFTLVDSLLEEEDREIIRMYLV